VRRARRPTLFDDGLLKAAGGHTTLEEVLRVASPPASRDASGGEAGVH